MPIYVTYNNGESASIDQGTRDVSSVLTSSAKAYACGFDSNETVDTGTFNPVSYTHLDVYKRQSLPSVSKWVLTS